MGRILKSYLFWTYPRGSFHYDVMVTLILAFLFLSPLAINYHDRPQETLTSTSEVLVKTAGANGLIYDIGADHVGGSAQNTGTGADLKAELQKRIEEISGNVQMDRYSAQKDASGRVTTYRVWAHR
jgi:hypothetical protein